MIRVDLDELLRIAETACAWIPANDLAFYFASGKSEGIIRDHIAAWMHKELSLSGSEYVTREWKRHDLAVIRDEEPFIIIEGKSWIYHDAYRKGKLLTDKNSILNGALRDIQKLIETKKQFGQVETYISTILYGIDTSANRERSTMGVTYYDSHSQGIKSAGNFWELNSLGRGHLTQVHEAFGATRRFPLKPGSYHGMTVEADMFITRIDNDLTLIEKELSSIEFPS